MNLSCLLLASATLLSTVSAFVTPPRHETSRLSTSTTSLKVASRDDLEYLPLSSSDMSRLTLMRERHATIPIMILDAMLPGQVLEFGSAEPQFTKLLQYVLESDDGEIGMIGINPHTGRPLNLGVTACLTENKVNLDDKGVWSISVQAKKCFEVEGEPWLDETGSFYLAHVEIVEGREEPALDDELLQQAEQMSDALPQLVEEWLTLVLTKEKSNVETMDKIMKDIGPMPEEMRARAIWIASLVNPLPTLGVCLEVRPAMLACKNDYDRMVLASAAIQSSIDHMKGTKKLF